MLLHPLKKCEVFLFLNLLDLNLYNICLQFNYTTNINKFIDNVYLRLKIPFFFFSILEQFHQISLKGSALYFLSVSKQYDLIQLLQISKLNFNIIFFPLYKKVEKLLYAYTFNSLIKKPSFTSYTFFLYNIIRVFILFCLCLNLNNMKFLFVFFNRFKTFC